MRPIHLADLDKVRPVLILTREGVRRFRSQVTVAPITSTIRGLSVEVPVGEANGLDHDSVINCDNVMTVEVARIGRWIGVLHDSRETELTRAIHAAFDLDDLPPS